VVNAPQESAPPGHRERLRQRFLGSGDAAFSADEALELLLCYAIPRKDVRPLSKALLNRFGSVDGVFGADATDLGRVEGLGPAAAILLKLAYYLRQTAPSPVTAAVCEPTIQPSLFAAAPAVAPNQAVAYQDDAQTSLAAADGVPIRPAPTARRRMELFAKSALKEAIALLPELPDTESLPEIRRYLRSTLPFSAEQTRVRVADYIVRRMFPHGYADRPLRQFAQRYAGSQALRDVCYYRFLKAEPFMVRVAEELLWPNIGSGQVARRAIADLITAAYPTTTAVRDFTQATVQALSAAGIATVDGHQLAFALRPIPLPAFAFVLHSEFPEPGIHRLELVEGNIALRALLWRPDQVLPVLYELRNRSLVTKVSEIDSVRQVSLRWRLEEVVERLLPERDGHA
jgi:hypothetical protein